MQAKKYIAEAIDTFVLTFFGCGSAAVAAVIWRTVCAAKEETAA